MVEGESDAPSENPDSTPLDIVVREKKVIGARGSVWRCPDSPRSALERSFQFLLTPIVIQILQANLKELLDIELEKVVVKSVLNSSGIQEKKTEENTGIFTGALGSAAERTGAAPGGRGASSENSRRGDSASTVGILHRILEMSGYADEHFLNRLLVLRDARAASQQHGKGRRLLGRKWADKNICSLVSDQFFLQTSYRPVTTDQFTDQFFYRSVTDQLLQIRHRSGIRVSTP